MIRIVETHFDESEILARWQQVSSLQQPHLIALRKYGQDELDGTPLVYAVMEPSDANLADVLKDRALTPQETRDLANSLVGALQALHENNLVHEHIEPANVLAVGETVKLRSDCIREAPEGDEGIAVKARDVHDLAIVLLQALTLRYTVPGTPLPAPFDAVIRNGISGAWGLPQIAAAVAPVAAPAPTRNEPVTTVSTSKPEAIAKTAPTVAATDVAAKQAPVKDANPTLNAGPTKGPAKLPTTPPAVRDRLIQPVEPLPQQHRGLWVGGAAAILLVLVLLWSKFHSTPSKVSAPTVAVPASSASTPAKTAKPSAASSTGPIRSAAASVRSTAPGRSTVPVVVGGNSGAKSQWRVVSYTYNREDQAQHKAETVAAQHGGLHPEVFSASGHAPYLVTLGGPMTRDQALALRDQARASGLPQDTYIQNYSH